MTWILVVFASASALALQDTEVRVSPEQSVSRGADNVLLVDGEPVVAGGEAVTLGEGTVAVANGMVTVGGEVLIIPSSLNNIVNIFWLVADTLTGMMAAPNLIALLVLSPLVFSMTKAYFEKGIIGAAGIHDSPSEPGKAPVDT